MNVASNGPAWKRSPGIAALRIAALLDVVYSYLRDDVLLRLEEFQLTSPVRSRAEGPKDKLMENKRLALKTDTPSGQASIELPPNEQITAAVRDILKLHVVNLDQGQFSADGLFQSSAASVDAIFREIKSQAAALPEGQAMKLLFFAHGGLVSEENALLIASQQIPWWIANGIYPVYFVWHTGIYEVLDNLLRSAKGAARLLERGGAPGGSLPLPAGSDHTWDSAIEVFVRLFGGRGLWSAIKSSAELANMDDGGATYVAQKLAALTAGTPISAHFLGHSAGAVFHSLFVPNAFRAGGSPFDTGHFLAPALTLDHFHQRLAPILGTGIKRLTLYSMVDSAEQQDTCDNIYMKSLLYLVHYACEHKRGQPLLGLRKCVDQEADMTVLWVAGSASTNGVWSPTVAWTGDSASQALQHGGYDEDPPTMNSVARRILDIADAVPLPLEYGSAVPRMPRNRSWTGQYDWPFADEGYFLGGSDPQGDMLRTQAALRRWEANAAE